MFKELCLPEELFIRPTSQNYTEGRLGRLPAVLCSTTCTHIVGGTVECVGLSSVGQVTLMVCVCVRVRVCCAASQASALTRCRIGISFFHKSHMVAGCVFLHSWPLSLSSLSLFYSVWHAMTPPLPTNTHTQGCHTFYNG